MVHTAIFLGAGASKAEGAPLQGELFHDYFSSDVFKNSNDNMDRELATFFSEMFQIDVDNSDISKIKFPTFEEVLGLTDLAIIRNTKSILVRTSRQPMALAGGSRPIL